MSKLLFASRKAVLVLLFAALGLWFTPAAMAQFGWDGGRGWGGTFSPTGWDCTPVDGTTTTGTTTTFEGLVFCRVTTDTTADMGVCQISLEYRGATQSCKTLDGTSTLETTLQCPDAVKGGDVTGAVTCDPDEFSNVCDGTALCGVNLDIDLKNRNKCDDVFGDANALVLLVTESFPESNNCTGHNDPGEAITLFCDGPSFSLADPARCLVRGKANMEDGQMAHIIEGTADGRPQTVNTTCPDQGVITATLHGALDLSMDQVLADSMTLEGESPDTTSQGDLRCEIADFSGPDGIKDGLNDQRCKFKTCPLIAPSLVDNAVDGMAEALLTAATQGGVEVQATIDFNVSP